MNSIFSAQKLVRAVEFYKVARLTLLSESYHRRLQSFWRGNGIPSAGCALDGRILHIPRTTGCLLAVPNGMLSNSTASKEVPTYHSLHQMSFLPPPSLRHIIAVPRQDKVDFRAACFCHKNIVDIGFVCSVCLSSEFAITFYRGVLISSAINLVFCSPVPVCSTCRCDIADIV